MGRREKWLDLVERCFGGTTAVCLLFLLFITMTSNHITGAELSLVLLLPIPGLVLLPVMALIGMGMLHCGYFEALELTTRSYGHGALLGIAILAATGVLCWLSLLL